MCKRLVAYFSGFSCLAVCYALNDSQGSVEQSDIELVLLHKTDCTLYVFVSRHMDVATMTTA